MRTVTFSDGTTWDVHPLTIGQMRKLRASRDQEALDQMFATTFTRSPLDR